MEFLDRKAEMERLNRLYAAPDGGLAVVWGRRRVGKTRLLLQWISDTQGIYWVADESAPSIQRRYFAQALEVKFPGFAAVEYPDWSSLFQRLAQQAKDSKWRGPLVLDEVPYLISQAKELPSILQRWIDHDAKQAKLVVALCGSSQSMMQGLVLDESAPLYGRAHTLLKIDPLPIGYMKEGFGISSYRAIVESYTLWGGVPRYWELASAFKDNIFMAADELALSPLGPLSQEPQRLLLEETPSAATLRPILDAIGNGAHRLTEIAARLNQPSTALMRYMTRLQELGLVKREIPFGELEKSSKKSLYKIQDPFLRFWFKVVAPNRGLLAQASDSTRKALFDKHFGFLVSQAWEDLCLSAIGRLRGHTQSSIEWMPAKRFWQGNGPEWDIVSYSLDQKYILLGEAKWIEGSTTEAFVRKALTALRAKGIPPIREAKECEVKYALFVPHFKKHQFDLGEDEMVISAEDVVESLK